MAGFVSWPKFRGPDVYKFEFERFAPYARTKTNIFITRPFRPVSLARFRPPVSDPTFESVSVVRVHLQGLPRAPTIDTYYRTTSRRP